MAHAGSHQRRLRAERELERIFEMSPALLAVAGLDGYLKRFNPAFALFGYSREELLSRPWIEFAHPDDRERMMEAAASLETGSDVAELENRVVCRDGSVRWVRWSTRVVPEEGLFYAAGRDVTENRQAEEEQAALRRVATLVARETPPDAVFAAVAREVGEVLGADAAHLGRFDPDGTVVSVGQWGVYAGIAIGARFPLDGDSISARILSTGRPARMDRYPDAGGVIATTVRELGIRASIGVPIVADGRTWGAMILTTGSNEPFPAETESRLLHFTELVATAISNAQAKVQVERLLEEQAALRRVATLVARETSPTDVFAAVADQAAKNLEDGTVGMLRFEPDNTATLVAQSQTPWDPPPLGTRFTLEGENVVSAVHRTRAAVRLDDWANATGAVAEMARVLGIRSSVAAPIVVEGRLWGTMIAVTDQVEPLPADTEWRLAQFTELVATAIANAEARAEVTRLAAEQSALRRVATLVAQGGSARAVFDAVTSEVKELLAAEAVVLARYDGEELIVLASRATRPLLEVGQRVPVEATNLSAVVRRTGRPAREDDAAQADTAIGGILRRAGVRARVVAPVIVEGRTWGVLAATWREGSPPPADTEARMASFAELLDTAIANADSREQLTASRARVLGAADDARRRVVRDLHDGAQQRLVHSIVALKLARQALHEHRSEAGALMEEALGCAEGAIADLRELSHGILPVGLMRGGLGAAVDGLVSRLELPVDVEITTGRLPRDVEASAYFIVAEALTNVVKHAGATRAAVSASVDEHGLSLEVRDDGAGGANPEGFGLVGIADRVDALGGELRIESEERGGTVVAAQLPLST